MTTYSLILFLLLVTGNQAVWLNTTYTAIYRLLVRVLLIPDFYRKKELEIGQFWGKNLVLTEKTIKISPTKTVVQTTNVIVVGYWIAFF